jgi:hypothetical protein
MSERPHFDLEVIDEGGDYEAQIDAWTEYRITSTGETHGFAELTCPDGVDERVFAGRVRAALDILNGHDGRDLALIYKLATVDDAAVDDHFGSMYWDILHQRQEIAEAPLRAYYEERIAELEDEVATLRAILAAVPAPEDEP